MTGRVLIVDDEKAFAEGCRRVLAEQGCGAGFVGMLYWSVYLRKSKSAAPEATEKP